METPAEILLISAMLRSGSVLEPAKHGLNPDHLHTFRIEYEWVLDYYQRHKNAPSKAAFKLAFPEFTILNHDDLSYAIEQVKRNHLRASLIRVVKEGTDLLRDENPEAALRHLASNSRSLHSEVIDSQSFSLFGGTEELYEEVSRRVELAKTTGLTGISTGIPTLDGRTSGAQPGDLWIIAARLGQGKTWTVCQMAEGALVAGKRVLFVSLEQTWRQIAMRVHTILGRRFGYHLRNTALSSGIGVDLHEYKTFLAELPDKLPDTAHLEITDSGRGRVSALTLASMIEDTEPDVVFIDYITLMATMDGRPATDDWRAAATISSDVKVIAGQYDIPIIAAAQINREGEHGTKPPSVAKLAQTDSLGQDAAVVVTMRRASNHVAHYLIAKNRHGEGGVAFWTKFNPDLGEFTEIRYEEALEIITEDDIRE